MSLDDDTVSAVRTEITRAIREGLGLHERYATMLADGIVGRLQAQCGGDRLYIPRPDRAARAERDERIRAEFDGRNHDQVCMRHGISRRQLYRILGG